MTCHVCCAAIDKVTTPFVWMKECWISVSSVVETRRVSADESHNRPLVGQYGAFAKQAIPVLTILTHYNGVRCTSDEMQGTLCGTGLEINAYNRSFGLNNKFMIDSYAFEANDYTQSTYWCHAAINDCRVNINKRGLKRGSADYNRCNCVFISVLKMLLLFLRMRICLCAFAEYTCEIVIYTRDRTCFCIYQTANRERRTIIIIL